MSELALMMHRAGLLSREQLAAVQDRSDERGLPYVDAVLQLGYSSEIDLVAFFHSRLTIPRVTTSILEALEPDTVARLPGELAHAHSMIPVSLDAAGNLTLAMADPTDHDAVKAATSVLGGYVLRAVAPVGALRLAILRAYPQDLRSTPVRRSMTPASLPSLDAPASNEPSSAYVADPIGPERSQEGRVMNPPYSDSAPVTLRSTGGLPRAAEVRPAPARHVSHEPPPVRLRPRSASARITGPVSTAPAPHGIEPLSPEAFERIFPRLVEHTTRDAITGELLRFLAEGFERVLAFVHREDLLRGHDARGVDLDAEALRKVRIPSREPSIFAEAIASGRPYFGPLRLDTPVNAAFAEALGRPAGNVLVLPVTLRGRVPFVVFASGARFVADPRSLVRLTEAASQAFERLIVERKQAP